MTFLQSKDILSKNLQKFRERTGVSQEEVSLDSAISLKSYSRIEHAKVHTSLKILDKISQGTGLSVVELLTEGEEVEM